MPTISEVNDVNRDLWDEWTPINFAAPDYEVEAFKDGKSTLKFPELEELGNVAGKKVLYLGCHFGLDTLSLARSGAVVTGVDYSERSIETARRLAHELNIPAQFIQSNIYDLRRVLKQTFDIVFVSYGTLHWLDDLAQLARIEAGYLNQTGFLFTIDFHPFFNMFDNQGKEIVFPYFGLGSAIRSMKTTCAELPPAGPKVTAIDTATCGGPINSGVSVHKTGNSAGPPARAQHVAYEWPHTISEIVMSVLDAGLRIESFREFPFITFNRLPYLKHEGEQRFIPVAWSYTVPMMFSIKASRMTPKTALKKEERSS